MLGNLLIMLQDLWNIFVNKIRKKFQKSLLSICTILNKFSSDSSIFPDIYFQFVSI
jgi:hypothetical protein